MPVSRTLHGIRIAFQREAIIASFYSATSSVEQDCASNRLGYLSAGATMRLLLAGVKPNSEAMRIMISAWRFAIAT